MADETTRRRIPGPRIILAVAILVVPIAAVSLWMNRLKPGNSPSGSGLSDLDVVCLGRVDGLTPVVSLEPEIPGRVAEVFVSEGQQVKAGDKLVKLEDESLRMRVDESEAAVAAANLEIELARLDEKLFPLRKSTQEAAVAAAAERIVAAEKLYQEKKRATMFNTVTPAELIAAEAEVNQLKQLKGVEDSRLEEVKSTEAVLRLKVKSGETRKTMALIAQKQAEKAVRDCTLVAPTSGVILRVQTSRGESIVPGGMQPIIFRPDSPLVVRAELEQEFLGRVRAGMKATVRDDARADSPTWHGKVLRVGNWVARKRTVLLDPGEVNDVRTVECVIELQGKTDGLLVGQRMRVRIGKAD